MGLFKKLLGNKVAGAGTALKKFEKKDLVEAAIGGMILVAYADGECEDSELKTLQEIIEANESFVNFQGEIAGLVDRFSKLMKAGAILGRQKIMKEINDLKSSSEDDRSEAYACMCAMAMADGELEEPEKKLLVQIGRNLGLSPEAFLG